MRKYGNSDSYYGTFVFEFHLQITRHYNVSFLLHHKYASSTTEAHKFGNSATTIHRISAKIFAFAKFSPSNVENQNVLNPLCTPTRIQRVPCISISLAPATLQLALIQQASIIHHCDNNETLIR